MADFSETQGGGALSQFLCPALNTTSGGSFYISQFVIQMQDTAGNTVGSAISASISWSGSSPGTEPGVLTATVTAAAFTGNASYTTNVDAIRLYWTQTTPLSFDDYIEIPLGAEYAMNDAGYTLDLTSFSITLNNYEG